LRNVNSAGRDAVDADDAPDGGTWGGRQRRVGLAPRRWCQVRVKARGRRWPTSPKHRGEHVAAV